MAINFFTEEVDFVVKRKGIIRDWIKFVINSENRKVGNINYIFASDEYVLGINISYLKHNYYTDVITFNYNETSCINGDIYISVERVVENSKLYPGIIEDEINRVMIHGVLHLLGYQDKTLKFQKVMRKKEDEWLKVLKSKFPSKQL